MSESAAPWLDVIGVGLDGVDGLSARARAALEAAEILIGAERHLAMISDARAEKIRWPQPFDAMIERLRDCAPRRTAALVTGDPLWFSAGALLARHFDGGEVRFHPHLSAFQLAAARLGWALSACETLTAHGRAPERILPFLAPGARLLVIGQDETTPARIAELLSSQGYGPSRVSVLSEIGDDTEARMEAAAVDWRGEAHPFHVVAIECATAAGADILPRTGLPDHAYRHDGKMTKKEIRGVTLASLWPRRGALLWDVGCGCGSVAIEWMRAAPDARAIGLEPVEARRAMAAENAAVLGAPGLRLIAATAPEALDNLPAPDAIFIGGGLSEQTIDLCVERLAEQGRLVANAVTLESETLLAAAQARHGGSLVRLSVARAEPIGGYHGWRPLTPVTQWSRAR